jgi:Kef-type K+ transport system membrane component KefB
MIGRLGVLFMIAQLGLSFDIKSLRRGGFGRMLAMGTFACVGTILTVFVIFIALGFDAYPVAITSAVCLSPMSVAIASKVLGDCGLSTTPVGQAIITSGFVTVTLSLVFISILFRVESAPLNAVDILVPSSIAIGFVVVGSFLSVSVFPRIIPPIYRLLPRPRKFNAKSSLRDEIILGAALFYIIGMSTVGNLVSSELLGAFLGGLSFATVPGVLPVWRRQLKRLLQWMVRIFFASVVAFSIPIQSMFNALSFGRGLLIFIAACTPKILSGAFSKDKSMKWAIGFSVYGRGELVYLIGQQSTNNVLFGTDESLITPEAYTAFVWGTLWCTIICPITARYFLTKYAKRQEALEAKRSSVGNGGAAFELVSADEANPTDGTPSRISMAVEEPAAVSSPQEEPDVLPVEHPDYGKVPVEITAPSEYDDTAPESAVAKGSLLDVSYE